ncbi:TetR/AcrR family transcriptional regulator [Paractinoplanes toevensis]|uniref:TetR/AcrR family transcriptional regulator n=1 Tax=Paractinoplanes toevensis TaxID=571911 RepID=UPI001BB37AE0|nr:TetR/AcrR family transcriptional regulator [Actinoplanes toevensis]
MSADVDVRVRRTRESLSQAVLRLAAEHPVEDIAVADVVRLARINRTTFYKHAASPADVLAEVLYADLDRIRTGWIAGAPAREVWERSAGELADHLQRFEDLYRTGLVGQRSAVLNRLLVEHFAGSALAWLDRDPRLLPDGAGSPQWRRKAFSRFIAHGEVGVVEAWLTEPAPLDRTLFISASASFMSTWLGGAG